MWSTLSRRSSYQLLPDTNNNNININISNIPIWKSWIKPVSLVTFSSVISVVTAPFVAITNYWKENTKFDFKNGWNSFTMNPFIFISSELVNSFFYTLAFFKIEFCLDTFLNNNLNCRDKLIIVAKNSILVVSLIFINEVSKNIIYNQLTIDKKIALSLFENFIFNFGKEIVIVIAWKIFKMSWENNSNCNSYINSILITALFAIGYGTVNVGQTLYTICDTVITNFFPTFCIILTSNIIISSLRIVASSSLSYFFSDIGTKWKNNRCCQRTLIDETTLLQEVVSDDTNSYGTFATTPMSNSSSIQFNDEDIVAINNDIEEDVVFNNNSVRRISYVG